MNREQALSFLRTVLQVGGGIAVGRGWIGADEMTALAGAVLTLAATAWSLYARRDAGLVAAAATVPEVHRIVAAPRLADAVPSGKVRAQP
ncbi:hypothetical protein [Methylobacterium oryzihabitans]|uniref:Holin n=1 Tax=Methylobacterium oryzihabitans TaxID=2499852 RepID=A0A3S3UDW6_9HYPH|nr:hypothetical protein [Methylobacterium oryzihabitans]RVU21772.1 hypothetical protein EOE48_01620 [Methylobacterium oryzihabitans]